MTVARPGGTRLAAGAAMPAFPWSPGRALGSCFRAPGLVLVHVLVEGPRALAPLAGEPSRRLHSRPSRGLVQPSRRLALAPLPWPGLLLVWPSRALVRPGFRALVWPSRALVRPGFRALVPPSLPYHRIWPMVVIRVSRERSRAIGNRTRVFRERSRRVASAPCDSARATCRPSRHTRRPSRHVCRPSNHTRRPSNHTRRPPKHTCRPARHTCVVRPSTRNAWLRQERHTPAR